MLEGILVTLRSARRRFRRASGSGRSASLALGTVDRSGFALGISMPGAKAIAWGCFFDFC
jgi:hypothetical protein